LFLKFILFYLFKYDHKRKIYAHAQAHAHARTHTHKCKNVYFFFKIFHIDVLDTSDTCQSSIHELNAKLNDPLQSNLQNIENVQNIETSSNLCTDSCTISLSAPNSRQNIHKPLLDKSKIESKRRNNIKASVEIEEIVSN